MRKDYKYILAYLIPFTIWLGLYFRGLFSPGAFYLVFILIPIVELLLPVVNRKLQIEEVEKKNANILFDFLLYANIPIIWILYLYGMNIIKTESLTNFEYFCLIINLGVGVATMGINVCHELGHRSGLISKILTRLGLLLSQNMYFTIEHNIGHHKYVCTEEDPGTARQGETLYQFWIRAITGVLTNAWRLEKRRLGRYSKEANFTQNQVFQFLCVQIIFLILMSLIFGMYGFIAALLIAIIAQLHLETINYIEHYGLKRNKIGKARYEPVTENHAWNSDHIAGRIFLYELTRHSDHHINTNKKYQVLENYVAAPQMKYGYPASMLLALIPSIWITFMDKQIDQLSTTN